MQVRKLDAGGVPIDRTLHTATKTMTTVQTVSQRMEDRKNLEALTCIPFVGAAMAAFPVDFRGEVIEKTTLQVTVEHIGRNQKIPHGGPAMDPTELHHAGVGTAWSERKMCSLLQSPEREPCWRSFMP